MPKIKILKAPSKFAKNGASITPLSDNLLQFNGPSHENGGIPMNINGQPIEVEGKETLYKGLDGTSTVFGNMTVPGTNMKFKDLSKHLAKKEQKVDQLMDTGNNLINTYDPDDKWESLKFNAGTAMLSGGLQKKKELIQNKEHLVSMQDALLKMADEMGADPQALSKGKIVKAKYGVSVKSYDNGGDPGDGKPSMAVRHNNPGNIKFGAFAKKYGAVQGEPATDGGYFAKFPDVDTGMNALKGLLKTKNYTGLTVEQGIKRWTGGSGYNSDLGALKGKTIGSLQEGDMNSLVNIITKGEDGKYYQPHNTGNSTPTSAGSNNPTKKFSPLQLDKIDITPQGQGQTNRTPNIQNVPDYDLSIHPLEKIQAPDNHEPLSPLQFMGEGYAAATNHVQPVYQQYLHPQLFQPYQVSHQDELNRNTDSFRALSKMLSTNPEALSTLAAQKYSADSQTLGEEFRNNQAIYEDITNKNTALINDAQSRNLQLSDQQYVRQQQARSNTKATNQAILNSVSSKILQNTQDNAEIKLYQNMYPYYRLDSSGNMAYYGPSAGETLSSGTPGGNPGATATTVVKDARGNVVRSSTKTSSQNAKAAAQIPGETLKSMSRWFNLVNPIRH